MVADAANDQLATGEDGTPLHAMGVLYAPDYVINAGGINNVTLECVGGGDRAEVERRIAATPGWLGSIRTESAEIGRG